MANQTLAYFVILLSSPEHSSLYDLLGLLSCFPIPLFFFFLINTTSSHSPVCSNLFFIFYSLDETVSSFFDMVKSTDSGVRFIPGLNPSPATYKLCDLGPTT